MRRIAGLLVAGCALALAAPASASITSVFPAANGSVSCTVGSDGVRFCGSSSPRSTTKTWDGVPIDVNVAFPPEPSSGPDGPWPLVILGHGYGGHKFGQSDMQPWLDRGYAVFSMTDRGFGESCGSSASRAADPSGCQNGYIRLMDDRYEVRDAQFFAGELVDEGVVSPTQIGATGGSYGGGLSMALAALKDRTMMPDGSLVPWTSPNGTPISLAAAAPNIPWTDLAASLMPNGSTLDYVQDAPYRGNPGVEKQSLVGGLYLIGCSFNFCAPQGSDPDADLTGWKNRIEQGEPYVGDPLIADALDELTTHHSSYYIDHSEPPAPLLISNGFTDDLFPVDEAVRYYNRTKTQFPNADISLFFGDFGHPRAQNKPDVTSALADAEYAWFDHFVKGTGAAPTEGVTAYTETCPSSAPSGGPYSAPDWAKMAPGEIRLDSNRAQKLVPGAGNPGIAGTFDPVGGGGACATAPATPEKGTASYQVPSAPAGGYTLLGAPTVIASFKSTTASSQVAARLLDVGPDGNETLVARGLWRPEASKKAVTQVFQLHPGAWHFDPGHFAKLELLPKDSPYGRASNGQQKVTVSNLELRLPVRERPGSLNGFIGAPAPKVVPGGEKLAAEFKGFGQTRVKVTSKKLHVKSGRVGVGIECPAKWVACHRGKVRIAAVAKRARFAVASGGFRLLAPGKSKVLKLKLTKKARGYLAKHKSLPASVQVSVAEQATPTTVKRKVVAH